MELKVKKTLIAASAVFFGVGANAAALGSFDMTPEQEKCGVMASNAQGQIAVQDLDSLKVIALTAGAAEFALPKDAPANVRAVLCARKSLVPEANDYKVAAAGLPLFITSPDHREALMEFKDGKLQYRAVEGTFSDAENPQVQTFLKDVQQHFSSPAAKQPSE